MEEEDYQPDFDPEEFLNSPSVERITKSPVTKPDSTASKTSLKTPSRAKKTVGAPYRQRKPPKKFSQPPESIPPTTVNASNARHPPTRAPSQTRLLVHELLSAPHPHLKQSHQHPRPYPVHHLQPSRRPQRCPPTTCQPTVRITYLPHTTSGLKHPTHHRGAPAPTKHHCSTRPAPASASCCTL
jgi:hypothetical protein